MLHEYNVRVLSPLVRSRLSRRFRLAEFDSALGRVPLFRRFNYCTGFVVAFSTLTLVSTGVFQSPGEYTVYQVFGLLALSLLIVLRLLERARPSSVDFPVFFADLELGSLLIGGAYALIDLSGGSSGFIYPIVYVIVAFLATFYNRWQNLYFLTLIGVAELALLAGRWDPNETGSSGVTVFFSHLTFIALFTLLLSLFLRGEVVARTRRMKLAVEEHLQTVSEEARDYRIGAEGPAGEKSSSSKQMRELRELACVDVIRDSLKKLLLLGERTLGSYTIALYWREPEGRSMRLKASRSRASEALCHTIPLTGGVVGAIYKRSEFLCLNDLLGGQPRLTHYSSPQEVTCFAGVPIIDGERFVGVLVADRDDGRAFCPEDAESLRICGEEILRLIQYEQVLSEGNQEKNRTEWFLKASREFNRTRTVLDVAKVAIKYSQLVSEAEFSAVVVAGPGKGEGTIVDLKWLNPGGSAQSQKWREEVFQLDEGLIGAALKSKQALPHGAGALPNQVVFAPGIGPSLAQVKVLPLLWNERGVGAIVVGSSQQNFLSGEALDRLGAMADQAAGAMANATMNQSMERLAISDGLTGLSNYRSFAEQLDDLILRGERYGRRLALVLVDIDHFKAINDTYGRPAGDQVLKDIAGIIQDNARKTDLVARYGGEEFAIVMEEVNTEGAMRIAERIRECVEETMFASDSGSFQCTVSMGVAAFGRDGTTKARLIVAADEALSLAKRMGRNRTLKFGDANKELRTSTAS